MTSCVGIDIGPSAIRLVELSQRFGKLHLLATDEKKLAIEDIANSPAGLESVLGEVGHQVGRRAKAQVVLGLPYNQVFFCNFVTELADPDEVRRLLRFELEDDIPIPFEDLVTDICGRRNVREEGHEYLIAAVSRRDLHAWADAVAKTGRRCLALSTDVCALHAALGACNAEYKDGTQMILHTDGDRIVLGMVEDGNIINARHLSYAGAANALGATLAREIELTCRAVYGRRRQTLLKIHLSGPDALIHELSAVMSSVGAGYEIHEVSLSSSIHSNADVKLGSEYALAFGLAATGLGVVGKAVNFLEADTSQADKVVKSRVKRTALMSAGLLVVILVLSGAKMFGDLRALEAQHTKVGAEIRAVFTEVFPDETKIVNELAQMTERFDPLRKECNMLMTTVGKEIRPLALLHIFSEKLTSDRGITISSFSVTEKIVRITGTGRSFESVEQFLKELHQVSYFRTVELEDVMLNRGSDRPEFRMLITVGSG